MVANITSLLSPPPRLLQNCCLAKAILLTPVFLGEERQTLHGSSGLWLLVTAHRPELVTLPHLTVKRAWHASFDLQEGEGMGKLVSPS